jgi:hypothetical protein
MMRRFFVRLNREARTGSWNFSVPGRKPVLRAHKYAVAFDRPIGFAVPTSPN